MSTVKIVIKSCILALAIGTMYSASAGVDRPYTKSMQRHHFMMNHKRMPGEFINYGMINPSTNTWLSIPENAVPGSRAFCWARDMMSGKLTLGFPNWGNVNITPYNPVAVFAVPQGGKFSVNYGGGHKGFVGGIFGGVFGMFGMGHKTASYEPTRLVCHFQTETAGMVK